MAEITPPLTTDPGTWGKLDDTGTFQEFTWANLISPPEGSGAPSTDADKKLYLDAAIAAVWWLTGTRFGRHLTPPSRPPLNCSCGMQFGSRWYDSIDLDSSGGERPVRRIERVTVNGVDLNPATDFGMVNARWLVRTPSGARFPSNQDITASPAPCELVWWWGLDPTADLLYGAVGPLVTQLWKAWDHQPCSLDPSVVQSIQREGISFALISPGEVWKDGYTGNNAIDAACVRAWPLGPRVQKSPGFFDPADAGPEFVVFERTEPTPAP